MANDRLWLKCEKCGEQILLAKYWGDGKVSAWDSKDFGGFIEGHAVCGGFVGDTFDGESVFSVVTDE